MSRPCGSNSDGSREVPAQGRDSPAGCRSRRSYFRTLPIAILSTVTFQPDPQIFPETEYHFDTLRSRLRELAFLNKGLKIVLVDERGGEVVREEYQYEFEDKVRQVLDDKVRPVECFAVARYALAARAGRAGSFDTEYTRIAIDRLQAYGDERIAECIAEAQAREVAPMGEDAPGETVPYPFASAEELLATIWSYPLHDQFEWHVEPVVDVLKAFEIGGG